MGLDMMLFIINWIINFKLREISICDSLIGHTGRPYSGFGSWGLGVGSRSRSRSRSWTWRWECALELGVGCFGRSENAGRKDDPDAGEVGWSAEHARDTAAPTGGPVESRAVVLAFEPAAGHGKLHAVVAACRGLRVRGEKKSNASLRAPDARMRPRGPFLGVLRRGGAAGG